MTPRRGEVWLFDCGLAEKVRPVLILSIPFGESDRALVTVVFHTTALRGSAYEVKVPVPFLKDGAFLAQSVATYPTARAIRRLGRLDASLFARVEQVDSTLLNLIKWSRRFLAAKDRRDRKSRGCFTSFPLRPLCSFAANFKSLWLVFRWLGSEG